MLTTALGSPACKSCSSGEGEASPGAPQTASTGPAGTYVYPKLQLVQIDDAWYALNQTCLQIYQQLQMCGTAQLMPVDVVPLNKVSAEVGREFESFNCLLGTTVS